MTKDLWSTYHAASESLCYIVNLRALVRINMADGPISRVFDVKRKPPDTHDEPETTRNCLRMRQLQQQVLLPLARKSAA